MSKKVMSIILAIIIAALGISLAACSKNEGTGETTTSASTTLPVTNGKLIVGFDPEFPPMGFTDNDSKYVGFDLDCAKAVAAKLNRELVLKPIDWTAKDTDLNAGTIDCIWNGFTMTTVRLPQYTWTQPYMLNEQVIVVLKDSSYNTKADLAGKKYGIQEESSAIDALDANKEFKNSLGKSSVQKANTTVLTELEAGIVDFVIMDSVVANYMNVQKNGKYRIFEEALANENFGIGFKLGNETLRDEVQSALKSLYADGTLKTISNTWFGKDVFINMD